MKYLSYICIQLLIVSYELHLFTEIWKICTHNRCFESTWTHHHSKTRWEEPRTQKCWVIVTCIRPPLRPPESRVSRQEGVHMYNILHLCVSATSVTTATLSFISLPFLRHPCVWPSSARGRSNSRGTRRAGRASLGVFPGKLAVQLSAVL